MSEPSSRFCIYSTLDDYGDFKEINSQLQKYDAAFLIPKGLGGGILDINYLFISLSIIKEFALSGGYDILKSFISSCFRKHIKTSKENNKTPAVKLSYLQQGDTEYKSLEMVDCSEEVLMHAIDEFYKS